MRNSTMIKAGAIALVLAGAAALNAHAQLSRAQQALQGSWEGSPEESLKPQFEQELKEQSDESLRTRLTNMGVNAARMNRNQMVEEYIKAAVQAARMSGKLKRKIYTFSGNIMTLDEFELNGARSTFGSAPFTADGATIN